MLQDIQPLLNKTVPNIALSVAKIALLVAGYILCRMLLHNIAAKIFRPAFVSIAERRDARTARVKALETMLRSSFDLILGFVALVMLLQIFGLNIVPIITTAGVAGLAVGFGAQKLVRDVISGFFIIIEDQYGVGDYISFGAVVGVVEALGIRTTSIRDSQGRLTIISNGIMDQVCNHSRGVYTLGLDYPVSAGVSPDKVREALDIVIRKLQDNMPDVVSGAKFCEGYTGLSGASRTYRIEINTTPASVESVKCRVNDFIDDTFTEHGITLV